MNSASQRKVMTWLIIAAMLLGLALPAGRSEAAGETPSPVQVTESEQEVTIATERYGIRIVKEGFKYSFVDGSGQTIAPAHAESGIRFGSSAGATLYHAAETELTGYDEDSVQFRVVNTNGDAAVVRIIPYERYAKFQIEPEPFQEKLQTLQGEAPERVEALIWGGDISWEDYTLELDMKQSKRDGSSTSGVLVRYQDYGNFYHVRYHLASGKLQLLKKRGGGALAIVQEAAVSGAFDTSKFYKMKVEAEGDQIRAYWNNTLLLDYTDEESPILSGAVGMRIYSDVTQYANMTVTSGGETLLDDSSWEEESQIHNGQWRTTGDVVTTAIIDTRTASMNPGYGLGDFAHNQQSTNVFGISNNDMTNKGADQRFVSNFTVFPAHGFAQVLFENGKKRVAVNAAENKLGVDGVAAVDALYYFMGTMEEIYADYQKVRVDEGYPVYQPKYDFFEVGYEAFGSLGWNTYQTSVMEDLSTYLDKGYKLKWGVVGSGFWKGDRNSPSQGATTSFGLWDDVAGPPRGDGLPNPRYPDVAALKQFFHENEMNLLLGLRINFKAMKDNGGNYTPEHDGPFSVEGIENGYFLSDENGTPLKYSVNFPTGSVHLLDAYNEDALDWYTEGVGLWGVDGFKEDTMMNTKPYQDGLWNNTDGRLMEEGYQVMVRNAAYSVPGDILRLEDTQHGHNQDRPILNALNYAASGAPNVYSDIVAGKYLTLPLSQDQKLYFMRNAMWAATTPAMSLGLGPWHMDNAEYEAVVKKAVDFHSMYAPYIYSAAVDSYRTGFPYTMTPLPIAYPDDAQTYALANRTTRQYEWMLGPSMLAVPAYGQDYATVASRDVYLPEGKWIDFETGQTYNGPATLSQYSLPLDKIPVFIGGKGVVVKQDLDSGKLLAEVYPIADHGSSYTYTYPDGETVSTILNSNTGWNRENIRIMDTTANEEVQYTYNERTGSYTFELTEGHHYELTGGEFDGTLSALTLPQDQRAWLIDGETLELQVEATLDSGQSVDPNSLELAFETDNSDVIAVSAAGEVVPLQTGTARVRVSAATEDGRLYSDWLTIDVLEPELTIDEPADGAELTSGPIVLRGASIGLDTLEARYNGIVQAITKGDDGSWEAALGRLANGDYGIQVVGRDKNGLIRLAEHIHVRLEADDMLLQSDFEEDSAGWVIDNGNWALAQVDGRGVYRATGRGLTHAGDTSWRDYRMEADMMMASTASGGSAGLAFRYQDPANFYHVRLDDNRSTEAGVKTIQLYKWVNGAASKVAEAPFEFEYDTWYTLAVEAEGESIQAYIDGELMLEAADSSLPSGAVGVRTYDRNTSVDRVTVSRLMPEESADAVYWRNGSASVQEAAETELTLSWEGEVQGVSGTEQYRVYANNELVEAQIQDHTAIVQGLTPGGLYAFKVEAGEEALWSTDGPIVVYRMPMNEPPDDGEDDGDGGDGGDNGDGGDGGNGGDGGSGGDSGTGSPVAEPGDNGAVRVVLEEELVSGVDGEVVIALEDGQRSVKLPLAVAKLDHTISIQSPSGGVRAIIDPQMLKEWLSGESTGQADSILIDLTEAAMGADHMGALGSELQQIGSGTQEINMSLVLRNGDIRHPDADAISGAVRLELAFDAAQADAELLGLYRYNEQTGAWEYAGGVVDSESGILTAEIDGEGTYALLERHKQFDDVKDSHWAYRTLQVLSAKHIINGVTDSQYAPSGLTTRAEFTALLVRALGLSPSSTDAGETTSMFGDVAEDAWYAGDVRAAYKAGLVQGVADDQFAPDETMTREQMAVMIVRAFEYASGQAESSGTELNRFTDRGELSAWAADAVTSAIAAGLMQGTATDTFNPGGNATRAQTAQSIYNLLKLLKQN